jgi:hypothetical protein
MLCLQRLDRAKVPLVEGQQPGGPIPSSQDDDRGVGGADAHIGVPLGHGGCLAGILTVEAGEFEDTSGNFRPQFKLGTCIRCGGDPVGRPGAGRCRGGRCSAQVRRRPG